MNRRNFLGAASACAFCAAGTRSSLAILAAQSGGRTASWYPSRYGPDDQMGAANLVTPEVTLRALTLVKLGKVLSLGLELNDKSPGHPPRKFEHYALQTIGTDNNNNDDLIDASLNVGTQIDGLGHLGIDGLYYNGNKWQDFVAMDGLKKLGVEHIPPMVTRGLVVDMVSLKGRRMRGGEAVTVSDFKEAARRQNITPRSGDVILFHTGWLDVWRAGDNTFWKTEPGPGREVAEYLCEQGAVALGADTSRLEADPFPAPDKFFPVHQTLLAKYGAYVLENWDTKVLIDAGISEFCVVISPTRITGATQTWVNPVVMV